MSKILVFGNSGSGKSTLAKQLQQVKGFSHCDLDTLAWQNTNPPQRKSLSESEELINDFIESNQEWVIEGCYSDLLELLLPYADQMIFLNLTVDQCINNAKKRPWEPHKYESKQAQDNNLSLLIDWIRQYQIRNDTFSQQAHQDLYDSFDGSKTILTSNSYDLSFLE